jgi:hypothetical protein
MKKNLFAFLVGLLSLSVSATTLPSMFYFYTSGTSGSFYIYEKINDNGVYLQFRIYHSVSTTINSNLWRIIDSYLVNYNGTSMTSFQQILTGGENEFVWKSNRPNVGDFTGGYHGDERIDIDPSSTISFYADGVSIPATSNIPLTACSSFYYVQNSTMHQTGTGGTDLSNPAYIPTPGNPIECFHEKRTVFENKGYTCYNKVIWNTDVPINLCYYGIFCVNKDISYQGSNQYETTAVFASDGSNKLSSDKQQINLWNTALGTSVVCNCSIVSLPFTPSLNTLIWDTTNYHKYYSKISSTNASAGDVWTMQSSISFDYSAPTAGFRSVSTDNRIKVSVIDHVLKVNGLYTEERFALYNISGLLLMDGNCDSNTFKAKPNNMMILRLALVDGIQAIKVRT